MSLNTFTSPKASLPIAPPKSSFRPLPEGSLRLADLGYFSLETLEKLTQAKVAWITRLKAGCRLFDETGEPLCLLKWLQAQTQNTVARHLRIGKTKQLPARLVAEKLSEQQTNKRRRDIRKHAKRRNIPPSPNAFVSQGGTFISPT